MKTTLTNQPNCPKCTAEMMQIRWEITAGMEDVEKEVEKSVFRCPNDDVIVLIEVPTGQPSKYAM